MTAARSSYQSLLSLASAVGCMGIEVRNDLEGELFDGLTPLAAAEFAQAASLQILALAEVPAFNDLSERAMTMAAKLAKTAAECGAAGISLIPRNDGLDTAKKTRVNNLEQTLIKLASMLEQRKLLGFIEPLGFEQSSLRYKSEVVDVIQRLGLDARFKLIHDTFHHHLAGEQNYFPAHTGIVHISGVTDKSLSVQQMRDEHRVLIDQFDRLNNIEQISALQSGGYAGPVSFEAFSPRVHTLKKPQAALLESCDYLASSMTTAVI